jgi:hypothetical protein
VTEFVSCVKAKSQKVKAKIREGFLMMWEYFFSSLSRVSLI